MPETLALSQLLYCAAVVFAAYFVRGIAGFGSALVAVPLLALVMPVTLVVPIIVLLDYLASLSLGLRNRSHIRWRELLPLLPFTLIGILTALYLLKEAEPGLLTKALGSFVVLYALYSLLPIPQPRGNRLWAAPLGLLAGLVGTTFGTGGPFTVIYLTLRGLEKLEFRGTISMVFILDGGMRLAGFTSAGFYHDSGLLLAAGALPLLAAGMYLGGHIHTTLSRQAFVRIIAAILIASGAALILK